MATHTMYKGGTRKELRYSIDQNPWYVKAGSILPLAGPDIANLQERSDVLGLLVIPGAGKSSFRLYEDDGVAKDYETSCAYTLIEKQRKGNKLTLTLNPREGSYSGAPAERELYVVLEGVESTPRSILINGRAAGECEKSTGRITITLPAVKAVEKTVIEIVL